MSALITCKFFIIPPLETIPKSPLRKSFSLVWCDKWLIIWYWPLKIPAKYLVKLLPFPIDVHSYPAKSKSLSRYIVFPLKDSLTVLSLTNFAIPASCFAVVIWYSLSFSWLSYQLVSTVPSHLSTVFIANTSIGINVTAKDSDNNVVTIIFLIIYILRLSVSWDSINNCYFPYRLQQSSKILLRLCVLYIYIIFFVHLIVN